MLPGIPEIVPHGDEEGSQRMPDEGNEIPVARDHSQIKESSRYLLPDSVN